MEAVEKSRNLFLENRVSHGGEGHYGRNGRFLTNIFCDSTGDTAMAFIKHMGGDSDDYEAILPADIQKATHWIKIPQDGKEPVKARIMALVAGIHVDLFNLRWSSTGRNGGKCTSQS